MVQHQHVIFSLILLVYAYTKFTRYFIDLIQMLQYTPTLSYLRDLGGKHHHVVCISESSLAYDDRRVSVYFGAFKLEFES